VSCAVHTSQREPPDLAELAGPDRLVPLVGELRRGVPRAQGLLAELFPA